MNKKFEYVDDNPGSYFGMLVESLNESNDYNSEVKDYNIYAIKKDGSSTLVKTIHGTIRDVEDEINSKFNYLPKLSFIKRIEVRDNNTGEKVYDESLKEQKEVTRDEKIKAISSNPEARKMAQKLTDQGELSLDAIISFVYADFFGKEESLKEDKFVPQDKMSKKAQKELNDKKRGTWGNTNPVTRVQPNKKAYDRKRDKKVVDEDIENKDSEEYLGVDEVKRFVNAREKLLDISDSMTTDLRLGRISREDVLYYRNEIKEIYSFLNSLYFGR